MDASVVGSECEKWIEFGKVRNQWLSLLLVMLNLWVLEQVSDLSLVKLQINMLLQDDFET
jgi:hypothetical protein